MTERVPLGYIPTTSTIRNFDLLSRQEFAWEAGASGVDPQDPNDPRIEVVVGDELIFGNTAYGSLHGFKFDDTNGDGVRDAGELPTPGVSFNLSGTDSQGNLVDRTEVTDINGEFWFTELLPGPNYNDYRNLATWLCKHNAVGTFVSAAQRSRIGMARRSSHAPTSAGSRNRSTAARVH